VSDTPAPHGVDTVLDYGFDASPAKHSFDPSSNRRGLFGPSFALVSDEFSRFQNPPLSETISAHSALVTLGGAAPECLWTTVLSAALKTFEMSNFLVPGSGSLSSRADFTSNGRVTFRNQKRGLGAFFEASDFAIVSAGVTMYEMIASGKPGIALVTADNQRSAFQAARDKGFVDGAEIECLEEATSILRDQLDSDRNSAQLKWLENRSLVDHFGPDRAVIALGAASNNREFPREAREPDMPFLLRLANQPSTREASISQAKIAADEHRAWFMASEEVKRRTWIYELGGVPLGQCRLDAHEDAYELDYSVLESCQGMGFGSKMLRLLLLEVGSSPRIVATVKRNNLGSISALRRVGFIAAGVDQHFAKFEWGY